MKNRFFILLVVVIAALFLVGACTPSVYIKTPEMSYKRKGPQALDNFTAEIDPETGRIKKVEVGSLKNTENEKAYNSLVSFIEMIADGNPLLKALFGGGP